ncbi:hypothetical protein HKX48_001776 [Thoreauomyces humboldtii]|nr:hypothetical protein HKX48_001776 [Thoreauomyces humboldtii]
MTASYAKILAPQEVASRSNSQPPSPPYEVVTNRRRRGGAPVYAAPARPVNAAAVAAKLIQIPQTKHLTKSVPSRPANPGKTSTARQPHLAASAARPPVKARPAFVSACGSLPPPKPAPTRLVTPHLAPTLKSRRPSAEKDLAAVLKRTIERGDAILESNEVAMLTLERDEYRESLVQAETDRRLLYQYIVGNETEGKPVAPTPVSITPAGGRYRVPAKALRTALGSVKPSPAVEAAEALNALRAQLIATQQRLSESEATNAFLAGRLTEQASVAATEARNQAIVIDELNRELALLRCNRDSGVDVDFVSIQDLNDLVAGGSSSFYSSSDEEQMERMDRRRRLRSDEERRALRNCLRIERAEERERALATSAKDEPLSESVAIVDTHVDPSPPLDPMAPQREEAKEVPSPPASKDLIPSLSATSELTVVDEARSEPKKSVTHVTSVETTIAVHQPDWTDTWQDTVAFSHPFM